MRIYYSEYDVMVYGFAFANTFSEIKMKAVYDKLMELYDEISEDMVMCTWDERGTLYLGTDECCWLMVANKYLEEHQIKKILDYIIESKYEDDLILFYPKL